MANIKLAKKQFVIDELAKKVDKQVTDAYSAVNTIDNSAGQEGCVVHTLLNDENGTAMSFNTNSADGADGILGQIYALNTKGTSQKKGMRINFTKKGAFYNVGDAPATTDEYELATKGYVDSKVSGGDIVTITADNVFLGEKVSGTITTEELELIKKDTTTLKIIDTKAYEGIYLTSMNKLVATIDETGNTIYFYQGLVNGDDGQFYRINVQIEGTDWTAWQVTVIGASEYIEDVEKTIYNGSIAVDSTYGWYNLTGSIEEEFEDGETVRGDFNYDGTSGVTFDDQAYTGEITVGSRTFSKVVILNMTEGFYLAYLPDDDGNYALRLVNNGSHTIDEALATLNSIKLTREYQPSPMDADYVKVDDTTIKVNDNHRLEVVKQEQEEFNTLIFDGELQAQTDSQVDFSAAQSVELGGVAEVSAAPTTDNGVANKGYVDTQVSTEATTRANADTTLQNNINTKLNLPGKVPGTEQVYNLPYYFYTTPAADKITVSTNTITLDNNATQGVYSLVVNGASTTEAGLLTASDKVQVNKIDGLPDGTTIVWTDNTHTNLKANIPSYCTFKGVATATPTTGMVTGDLWFIGSAQPYTINIYNGTSWVDAGQSTIDISAKADKNNTELTGSGTFVNLTGSGELSMTSDGTVDISKAKSVNLGSGCSVSDTGTSTTQVPNYLTINGSEYNLSKNISVSSTGTSTTDLPSYMTINGTEYKRITKGYDASSNECLLHREGVVSTTITLAGNTGTNITLTAPVVSGYTFVYWINQCVTSGEQFIASCTTPGTQTGTFFVYNTASVSISGAVLAGYALYVKTNI